MVRNLFVTISVFLASGAAFSARADLDPRPDATDHLNELVKAGVMQLYPGARIELTGPLRWSSGSLPAHLGPLSASVLGDDGQGNAQFQVIDAKTGSLSDGFVSFAAWVPARVAVRRIAPGERLSPELFMPQELDVARGLPHEYRGVVLPKKTDVAGLEATQTVLEGQFLTSSAVRRVPDVRRGDVVKIRIVSGDLELSTQGTAEEPGYRDGNVRVLARPTKRELVGKLEPDGTVEVAL